MVAHMVVSFGCAKCIKCSQPVFCAVPQMQGTEVCLLLDAMTAVCIVLSYPHLNTWLLRIAVVAVIACAVAVARLQCETSHHRIPFLAQSRQPGPRHSTAPCGKFIWIGSSPFSSYEVTRTSVCLMGSDSFFDRLLGSPLACLKVFEAVHGCTYRLNSGHYSSCQENRELSRESTLLTLALAFFCLAQGVMCEQTQETLGCPMPYGMHTLTHLQLVEISVDCSSFADTAVTRCKGHVTFISWMLRVAAHFSHPLPEGIAHSRHACKLWLWWCFERWDRLHACMVWDWAGHVFRRPDIGLTYHALVGFRSSLRLEGARAVRPGPQHFGHRRLLSFLENRVIQHATPGVISS